MKLLMRSLVTLSSILISSPLFCIAVAGLGFLVGGVAMKFDYAVASMLLGALLLIGAVAGATSARRRDVG